MEQPLPEGFIQQYDSNYKRFFYVNTNTGQSQWDDPREQKPVEEKPVVANAVEPSAETESPAATAPVEKPQDKAAEQPLPEGFIQQWDDNYKRFFYVNTKTGQSQWEDPREQNTANAKPAPIATEDSTQSQVTLAPPTNAEPQAKGLEQPLPEGFIQQWDSNHNRLFFVNTKTGQSQWEDPRTVQAQPYAQQPYGQQPYGQTPYQQPYGQAPGQGPYQQPPAENNSGLAGMLGSGAAGLGVGALLGTVLGGGKNKPGKQSSGLMGKIPASALGKLGKAGLKMFK